MAYNIKSEESAYHVKITNVGRQLLAQGTLTFRGFALGDSEVDYAAADATGTELAALRVLRPVDAQPDIKYPVIPRPGVAPIAPLFGVSGDQQLVRNAAPSRGPFRRGASAPGAPLLPENELFTALPVDDKISFVRDRCHVSLGGSDVVSADKAVTATAGDWLLVHVTHGAWTPAVQALGDRYALAPAAAGVYLQFRIVAVAGASLTLDRPTPGSGGSCPAWVLPGGEPLESVYGAADPVADWDEDTLGFALTPPITSAQVGLWNCNLLYGEPVMGSQALPWSDYPSNAYAGARRYLGYTDPGKAIALLHYTNHVVHNLYGEGLVPETVVVNLPGVLWWANPSGQGGVELTSELARQQVNDGASAHRLIYHVLRDPQGRAVGRVFPALKVITLDDVELVAALSAKSNRNWTLPPFELATAGGAAPAGSVGATQLHVTYAFENDPGQGYGLRSALPCQYVSVSAVTLAQLLYFEFKLPTAGLWHLQDDTSAGAAGGGGFSASRLVLLFQETAYGARPAADAWVRLDVTPAGGGAYLRRAAASGLVRVEGQALRDARAAAQAGTFYELPGLGAATGLPFGAETVLLGNVRTDIEALVFRTSFLLSLGDGEYANSSNPTWLSSQPVAITEVGIYDATNQLVAVGKLTDPLVKSAQGALFLEVSLDF